MIEINGRELIKEYFKTSLEARIKDWDGKECLSFCGISASDLHDILPIFDFDIDECSLDLNGWDGDYWLKVKYKNEQYTLAGSFFYGNHSIYKED